MRDIAHPLTQSDAEGLRLRLESEGIHAEVRQHGYALPSAFVVSVADPDYERAVAVRRLLESQLIDRPSQVLSVRTVLVVVALTGIALLAFFITILRH